MDDGEGSHIFKGVNLAVANEEFKKKYSKLKEECLGIRVFFFNQAEPSNCDHSQFHNDSWKEKMKSGNCLEAGTTVGLTQYSVTGVGTEKYLLIIQWDCGFEKAYGKAELENIRVFDLGPTGQSFSCFTH